MKGLIDFTGNITGQQDLVYQYGPALDSNPNAVEIPDDFSYAKYNYIPSVAGVYDPNGFILKSTEGEVDIIEKRRDNIRRMNAYMRNLLTTGAITQAAWELFVADTAVLAQNYIEESGRIITWVETTSRNGYNATTSGFKTKTSYRGNSTNGQINASGNYPRANDLLLILNDL